MTGCIMDEICNRRTWLYGRQWFVNSIGDYCDKPYATRIAKKIVEIHIKIKYLVEKTQTFASVFT